MDANTLATLVKERYDVLVTLLEISRDQFDAVENYRMTDLMNILSKKQKPIKRLAELTQQLRPALSDDPESRNWPNPSSRDQCRKVQSQCDQLHEKLLEIEAACETKLLASRSETQGQLERLSSGNNAASGYSQAQRFTDSTHRSSSGAQLDLSSD